MSIRDLPSDIVESVNSVTTPIDLSEIAVVFYPYSDAGSMPSASFPYVRVSMPDTELDTCTESCNSISIPLKIVLCAKPTDDLQSLEREEYRQDCSLAIRKAIKHLGSISSLAIDESSVRQKSMEVESNILEVSTDLRIYSNEVI